jgi:hypothetical protein
MGKIFLIALLACGCFCYGQTDQTDDNRDFSIHDIPSRYFETVDKKIAGLDEQISKQTEKYLKALSKQEDALSRKLSKYDSTAATLLGRANREYADLARKLNSKAEKLSRILTGPYMPYLDSLQGSLSFLRESKQLVTASGAIAEKIAHSLEQVKLLQEKLNEAENIKYIIQERQEEIKQLLSKYTDLPKNISRYFGKYQKEVYYYGQQIRELRETLNDPGKLEQKMLEALNRVPAFREFIRKNSMLASLFAPVVNSGGPVDPSLQTRSQVQQLIQQRALSSGPNGQQLLNQQIQAAQAQLTQLKNKLNQLGGSANGDMNLPNFRPNAEKVKSLFQRLEYGASLQSARASNYFPVTSDFGFSIGYKLNPNSVIGIGGSFKVGWGKDWNHIHISGEGAGLRTFVDWKVKRGIWLSGGAEMNYMKRVSSLEIFKNYTTWQKSALLGLSKRYNVGKKLKGNLQMLYDFLHDKHVPRTSTLLFRVGYNF